MTASLKLAYFAHSIRSDWNNGNAHFLRGLLRALAGLGHEVTTFEPKHGWSIDHLCAEPLGAPSLREFEATYPELRVETYEGAADVTLAARLAGVDVVILHEWNEPVLARELLHLRARFGFKLLFHDTHHRASSSPQRLEEFGLAAFDGVLAFGESLRSIYRERFGLQRVWTLHEAADTTVFRPPAFPTERKGLVWIGNWGDGERSREIVQFLLQPSASLRDRGHLTVYGVRYPEEGLAALAAAGADYGGYLPNLSAPQAYARARLTVHVPRQQYQLAMTGIPTIRVFEALACGIPLLSAPWQDTEELFREGDFVWVKDAAEAEQAMRRLLEDDAFAQEHVRRGLETVLARHTCGHRALQLIDILGEVL